MRSHNDAQFAEKTLEILMKQNEKNFEIISLDDNSTDGTCEIISRFPSVRRIFKPENEKYVPGRVLNRAVREARGKYIVFLNCDAVPLDESYLEKMTSRLISNEADVVYGNQICRPGCDILVRKDYERAFGDGKIAASWGHFFSMASSAVSKKLALENPFDETLTYSEDIEWSLRLKNNGFRIAYAPECAVEHSHNYTLSQVAKRFYNEGVADRKIYGTATQFHVFARQFVTESFRDVAYTLSKGSLRGFFSIIPYRFTQKFNYWRGRRKTK